MGDRSEGRSAAVVSSVCGETYQSDHLPHESVRFTVRYPAIPEFESQRRKFSHSFSVLVIDYTPINQNSKCCRYPSEVRPMPRGWCDQGKKQTVNARKGNRTFRVRLMCIFVFFTICYSCVLIHILYLPPRA
jgi:hypothetical protein